MRNHNHSKRANHHGDHNRLINIIIVISDYYYHCCCCVNVIYITEEGPTSLDKIPMGVSNDQLPKVPWFRYRALTMTKLSQWYVLLLTKLFSELLPTLCSLRLFVYVSNPMHRKSKWLSLLLSNNNYLILLLTVIICVFLRSKEHSPRRQNSTRRKRK